MSKAFRLSFVALMLSGCNGLDKLIDGSSSRDVGDVSNPITYTPRQEPYAVLTGYAAAEGIYKVVWKGNPLDGQYFTGNALQLKDIPKYNDFEIKQREIDVYEN